MTQLKARWKEVFAGPNGLRAGWSLGLFFIILVAFILGLQNAALHVPRLAKRLEGVHGGVFGPLGGLINEAIYNLSMLLALLSLAKIERRRLAQYGWHPQPGAARRLAFGSGFGLLIVAAMYVLEWTERVYSFGSWALAPRVAVGAGLLWAATCLLVGLFEEGVFRGYSQFTLGRGIGFWPAAFVISFAFGMIHLLDSNYRVMGIFSAGVFGFLFVFCLWRTGDLWLSIGIHAAVDFAELFVFAPSNSFPSPVHLLTANLHGPSWLTGATIGPEASINGYAVLALAFAVVGVATKKGAAAFNTVPGQARTTNNQ